MMPKVIKTEPEKLSRDHNIEAIEMLTQGRGLAFQLRDLFLDDQIHVSEDKFVLAEDLLEKIDESFADTISALDREFDELQSEDQSAESSKIARKSTKYSNRKRREKSEGQSWTQVDSSLVHDGHAWRKYGQKSILNAKHSRSYYKCTNKENLGCPAKKHVQQIEDDPVSYRTVYSYRHTCTMSTNDKAETAQMVLESAAVQANMIPSSSIILNFQSDQPDFDSNNYVFHSSDIKQEGFIRRDPTDDEHFTSGQQLISMDNLGAPMMGGMDDFMTCSADNYPCTSYPQDAVDLWSYN